METCPECKGSKIISLPYVEGLNFSNMPCPTCEGTGELPDRAQFPNNCPACGEPIPEGREWCDFHKAAGEME